MPPRPADDPLYPALREKAFRLLARREHSAWELRRKLRGGDDEDDDARGAGGGNAAAGALSDELLSDLTNTGAQSDARFAEQLCRLRYESGCGPLKLRAELRRHRIAAELIDAVMAEYAGKWRGLAAQVRRKKFGARAPASFAEWAAQARFLERRGFAEEEIEAYAE